MNEQNPVVIHGESGCTSNSLIKFLHEYKLFLIVGGIWNIVIGSYMVITQPSNIPIIYTEVPPLAAIFANHSLWMAATIAGIGYASVGFRFDRWRFILVIGAILKLLIFCFFTYLWLNSRATTVAFAIGVGDLLWAIYFAWFLFKTKANGYI